MGLFHREYVGEEDIERVSTKRGSNGMAMSTLVVVGQRALVARGYVVRNVAGHTRPVVSLADEAQEGIDGAALQQKLEGVGVKRPVRMLNGHHPQSHLPAHFLFLIGGGLGVAGTM